MTTQPDRRDEFIERAEAQLRTLRDDDKALEAQEQGVQRKREELAVQIAGLRGSVATYRELMDLVPEETPAVGLFDEEVPQGTIAEMAATLIERHGGPMKVVEITRQLERVGKFQHGGGDNSARDNYGTVYGTLKRHKLFELTSAGGVRSHPVG